MHGASRTMEDLENFWNERSAALFASLTRSDFYVNHYRASIEEEYAKRLTTLTKLTLGEDEIGYVFSFHAIWICRGFYVFVRAMTTHLTVESTGILGIRNCLK